MIHTMLSSQTMRDIFLVVSGNVLSSFFAFLYTIALARVFSPSDFGIFSAVLAFILLVSDISDIGIGSSLSRFLPDLLRREGKRSADSFLKTAFHLQLSITLVVGGLIVVFSRYFSLALLRTYAHSDLFFLAGWGVVGTILVAFASQSLSAQRRYFSVVLINSFSTFLKLLFVLFLFSIGVVSLPIVLTAFCLSLFLSYVLSLRFLPLTFLSVQKRQADLKRLLSFSVYLAVARVFSATSSRLDALMLIPLSSSYDAGIYSGAYKIAFLYIMLASSMSMVIAPRLSAFGHVRDSVRFLTKVAFPVSGILLSLIFLYFIAPSFVIFVLGSSYSESVAIFRALLFPMFLFTLTILPVNFLIYALKKPFVSTINTFFQVTITFFGNFFLIPRFGSFGPVITLSLSYGFTLLSASFFSYYYFRKEDR